MTNIARTLLLGSLLLSAMAGAGMAQDKDFSAEYRRIIKQAGEIDDSTRLHDFFDVAWKYRMASYPEWATSLGHPGYNHLWTDYSFDAIELRKADRRLELQVLESIAVANLSAADQLNHALYYRDAKEDVAGQRFPQELLAISQMGGVHQNAARQLQIMPAATVAQCEDILSRLRAYPERVGQTIALLDSGLQAGVTPPKVTLRDVPQQVLNQITDDPADAPLLRFTDGISDNIPTEQRARVVREATDIYTEQIVPALTKFHAFVDETYLPGCRETIGFSALPDGEDWYAHRVQSYTTTELTPNEIFQIGHSEVKRIRAEMERIIEETGFEGDFAAFSEFLRTDDRFFHETAEDLLAEYRAISKRVDPQLIKLFGHLPRLPYGVTPVPSYAEKSQTTAYYEPGSLEAGRPGYFYANTYDLKSRPRWEMEALTLHEAVPGHHLQIAIAQELDHLPMFRQHGWVTAYGEGWGLYAESLGEEMGFYTDPYSKFGQLTYEMWRAIRLVVDVGLHAKGWSRDRAIEFFRENSSKAQHDIEVEIDRYIVWPGQALAYKIGELKIKELRAYAEAELGEKFDIRGFHDHLLSEGAMPLGLLEKRMKDWVDSRRQGG